MRINIDVLNAENQVYNTRRDLARATFDTLLAQLRLKAAVGSLGEEDLLRVNALLDPRRDVSDQHPISASIRAVAPRCAAAKACAAPCIAARSALACSSARTISTNSSAVLTRRAAPAPAHRRSPVRN